MLTTTEDMFWKRLSFMLLVGTQNGTATLKTAGGFL